jgi:hypothetical protein
MLGIEIAAVVAELGESLLEIIAKGWHADEICR